MNKDKVFLNVYLAICTSNGFYKSNMDFEQAVSCANSVVESLFAADLLLLKDESKQPQPPDFANTMLGEVPPVVNDGTEEISKAVEGATPVVRQNAQTKEVCPFCKSENTEQVEGINYRCNNCESTWANW